LGSLSIRKRDDKRADSGELFDDSVEPEGAPGDLNPSPQQLV
jgi:hypothetical protein